jgi:kynureninase
MSGIDGWMLSNANIISSAAHLASLALFESADISQLREKSLLLTGYLYFLLTSNDNIQKKINILTPANETERGCQLSLFFHEKGRKIFDALTKEGVIMDWREPNVIRVAPTPMYNTFEEVKIFSDLLEHILIEG